MPSHATLLDRMSRSIAGEKVQPLNIPGGSLNYKFMDELTLWISSPTSANRENLLRLYRNMEDYGHFTIKGPRGYACEINCVGAHYNFSLSSWLGTMIWADKRDDYTLFSAARSAVNHELILCQYFNYQGQVCAPGARVKDEKRQTGLDSNKDRLLALATGRKFVSKNSYWQDVQNLCVKLMRDCIERDLWGDTDEEDVRERGMVGDLPHLPFPIHKKVLDDGGYLAWIDKDEFTTKLLGRDALSWVLTGPSANNWHGGSSGIKDFRFGYDWVPLPEVG